MDSKNVEDDAKNWEHPDEWDVERNISCRLESRKILTIEVSKYCVCSNVAYEENSAEDCQSQLAHTLAEEHDAHEAQEDDHDAENAEAPRSCTFVCLERLEAMECEVAELSNQLTTYEVFADVGDESHKCEDDDQCKIHCL